MRAKTVACLLLAALCPSFSHTAMAEEAPEKTLGTWKTSPEQGVTFYFDFSPQAFSITTQRAGRIETRSCAKPRYETRKAEESLFPLAGTVVHASCADAAISARVAIDRLGRLFTYSAQGSTPFYLARADDRDMAALRAAPADNTISLEEIRGKLLPLELKSVLSDEDVEIAIAMLKDVGGGGSVHAALSLEGLSARGKLTHSQKNRAYKALGETMQHQRIGSDIAYVLPTAMAAIGPHYETATYVAKFLAPSRRYANPRGLIDALGRLANPKGRAPDPGVPHFVMKTLSELSQDEAYSEALRKLAAEKLAEISLHGNR